MNVTCFKIFVFVSFELRPTNYRYVCVLSNQGRCVEVTLRRFFEDDDDLCGLHPHIQNILEFILPCRENLQEAAAALSNNKPEREGKYSRETQNHTFM